MSTPEIEEGCQLTEEMYCVHLVGALLLRSLCAALRGEKKKIKSCCGLAVARESNHFLLSSVNNSWERFFG